jgi:hypothetical protein
VSSPVNAAVGQVNSILIFICTDFVRKYSGSCGAGESISTSVVPGRNFQTCVQKRAKMSTTSYRRADFERPFRHIIFEIHEIIGQELCLILMEERAVVLL